MAYQEIDSKVINSYTKITVLVGFIILLVFNFAAGYAIPLVAICTILALSYVVAQFEMAMLFRLMVLLIPVSTNQKLFDSEVSLLMPSEPIEAVLVLAFGIKLLMGYKISSDLLKHPIFILLVLGLGIQFLALFNSAMVLVSLKSLFLKSCYFIVFFVLSADLFIKRSIDYYKVLKTYTFSLFIVGVIIFVNHLNFGLSKDISGSVTEPFYADHTIYSACLAMILPLPLLFFYYSKSLHLNFYQKFWIGCLCIVLLMFFFFTYCRAGWISLVIALLLVMAVTLGLKFRSLFIGLTATLVLLITFQTEIADSLKQNKADSNAKNASLEQQTKSVTNITSDQSNAERLNRWSCAWRMFLDKPMLGYGPGTYQFEYLSYQKKSEMTRISVTSAYNIKKGKGGTAHSEYLLLLSESGIFSFIIAISSILITIFYALKVYSATDSVPVKIKIMIAFFSFSTYILHAFFNNFLDTDKAAILYYISIAAILTESIHLKKSQVR